MLDGPGRADLVRAVGAGVAWNDKGELLDPILTERYRPHGQGCGDKPVSCART